MVKFILEDEPSLVREKLTENCFADNDNNEYAYFVKKGSDIPKLARKVKEHLDNNLSKVKGDELRQKLIELAKKDCKNIKKFPN
ncbi:MAG: hypothetical protein O7157_00850 [Wolbachia endosymbiont of Tetragnatha montana]|nr:hypothetical protein [Wolbachia endosymbiont of Tetragnatha montana]